MTNVRLKLTIFFRCVSCKFNLRQTYRYWAIYLFFWIKEKLLLQISWCQIKLYLKRMSTGDDIVNNMSKNVQQSRKKKYTLKLTFNLYIQVISWLANPHYTDISAELLPLPFLSSYLFTDLEWLQWQTQGRGPGVRVPLFLDKTEPTPLTWGSGSATGNVACKNALHLGESGEVTCEYRSDSAVSSTVKTRN